MKLCMSRSKNTVTYYIGESYRDEAGRSTTRTVGKLGTQQELIELWGLNPDDDVKAKAQAYIAELNAKKKADKPISVTHTFVVDTSYAKGEKRSFNVGYMFLRRLLLSTGFEKLIDDISSRYKFEYDFGEIFSDLIYARILEPTSKRGTLEFCRNYLYESPSFESHDIYRALDVINKENDFIQSLVYKGSNNVLKRNTEILYYDCTNFYFEISVADEFRTFGISKENRPNPIVQMGLFMDGSGIPLAFTLTPDNRNEQITMVPLEKKIIKDFELAGAELTICADAGLCSAANKRFNSQMNRNFIVIKPIKSMSKDLQSWVLNHGRSLIQQPLQPGENPNVVKRSIEQDGWRCDSLEGIFSIDDIDESDPSNFDRIFYKERYLILDKESGKTERLIITYSLKYKRFMQKKRERDLERAKKLIKSKKLKKGDLKKPNDVTRYIKVTSTTDSGEQATNTDYELDQDEIDRQSVYDGFYAVSTSFDMDKKSAKEIANINHGRWEIEESFRILKSEFRARPVYVRTQDHIVAHFIVCFMALLVFRLLEKFLNEGREKPFTAPQIVSELRNMCITKVDKFFSGSFIRTDLTDRLKELMDMKFDCEFITKGLMNKNLKQSKKIFYPLKPPQ